MTDDSVLTGDSDQESPQESDQPSTVGDEEPRIRSRRRRWLVIGLFALIGAGLVAALFLIHLPYYLIQPGSVKPSEQRIEVKGADSYENRGRIMFTTVFIDQATPALLIRAWLDSAVEVRTEKEMFGDSTRSESRQQNVELMADSKLVATKVALTYLGHDASFEGRGAQIAQLSKDSPSKGILKVGDVITSVDGAAVTLPDDIGAELEDRKPGDKVEVVAERTIGKEHRRKVRHVEVTLGSADSDPSHAILGVVVQAYDLHLDSPVDVRVDSGRVTGPSAGLAWTLAIIDRLTPGSLTDGKKVAVTGEIRADGSVGPIGGIVQKVSAVKRAGITTFLYPAATSDAEVKAMRQVAGDAVELHAVSTVDDAIEILAPEGLPGH